MPNGLICLMGYECLKVGGSKLVQYIQYTGLVQPCERWAMGPMVPGFCHACRGLKCPIGYECECLNVGGSKLGQYIQYARLAQPWDRWATGLLGPGGDQAGVTD